MYQPSSVLDERGPVLHERIYPLDEWTGVLLWRVRVFYFSLSQKPIILGETSEKYE
jgi:hypothetical protein